MNVVAIEISFTHLFLTAVIMILLPRLCPVQVIAGV